MKIDWKKEDKQYYGTKTEPAFVDIPEFGFYVISGEGNPNSDSFGAYIEALYAASYTIRMSPKQNLAPPDYKEYTVYPLEGVWSIKDPAAWREGQPLNKDDLTFDLMIRQPSFVQEDYALEMLELCKKKKSLPLLKELRFLRLSEGPCVQILHEGSYDTEPASFARMEAFCETQAYKRKSKIHREIYLSDPRRTAPNKLRTLLRFQVEV